MKRVKREFPKFQRRTLIPPIAMVTGLYLIYIQAFHICINNINTAFAVQHAICFTITKLLIPVKSQEFITIFVL